MATNKATPEPAPEPKHSKLCGGSKAGRYINCIGSDALAKLAPPPETSEFALDGTMLHFVIEEILNADEDSPDADPLSYIGEEIVLDETDDDDNEIAIEFTEEHAETKIIPALRWFDELLDPEQYWCEQRVGFTGELEGAYGTGDVLFVNEDSAGLVDWKFGDGVMVDAADNSQLKFYLAAALKLDWFDDMTAHLGEFHGYIVQPVEDREQIASHAVYTRAELKEFEASLLDAKHRKEAGDAELTVGAWCKFCPAETICPAWRNRGADALKLIPRETLSGKGRLDYDHDMLREAFMVATAVAGWADAVKKRVKAEFDASRPIDGLKKVIYKNSRQWVDENKTKGWLRRHGLKAGDYQNPAVLKSPAAIEKIVGKGKLPDAHVRNAPAGFSYVPADDPRPAYEDGRDPQGASKGLADALKTK